MPRVLLLLVFIFLTACSDNKPATTAIKLQGSTMGTTYHVTIITTAESAFKVKNSTITKLQPQIDRTLLAINQQMSTYSPTSEISLFNNTKQTNWFSISSDFAQVVATAQQVSKESNGAFDITVAPLIDLWGFGSTTQLSIPSDLQIQSALKNIGYQKLEVRLSPPALRKLNPKLHIDLSAIAKGFAVDKISEFLSANNYQNHLVEIGGEVRNSGVNQTEKPWRIGIETPQENAPQVSQTLLSSNIAIATSGDYRNYFMKDGKRFSHTINPNTGKPITHSLASVTVLNQSTMLADAYATTLMVLGENKGKAFTSNHQLKVNMIIRNNDSSFKIWKNFNEADLIH